MKKALGILGGMGPQATLDLQQKILNLTDSQRDQDHLRIYVDNHPQIPERISAVLRNTMSPVPAIQESLDKLAAMGAGCIVMPCVSAHYFLPQLVVPPQVVFLDMLKITAENCSRQYAQGRAGVLCSEATAKSGLLSPYLESFSLPYLYPQEEDQRLLGHLIFEVKAKTNLSIPAASLRSVALEMAKRGADYFILACTELPLLVQYELFPYAYLDVTAELAKAAILHCGYKLKQR
jgi:aspartate racemase